jgi:hypothetical protein
MKESRALSFLFVIFGTMLTGCVVLAPGADQVKVTTNPSDVAKCTAAGNVKTRAEGGEWPGDISNSLKNEAVGLNATTIFLTGLGEGIAYRCEQSSVHP